MMHKDLSFFYHSLMTDTFKAQVDVILFCEIAIHHECATRICDDLERFIIIDVIVTFIKGGIGC